MVDSSYATGSNGRSITSFVIYVYGCPVNVYSKKQGCVTLSSCEAEYIAAQECAKMLTWVSRLAAEFGIEVPKTIVLLEDNKGDIGVFDRSSLNQPRTRHMDVSYHWLQERVRAGEFKLAYIPDEEPGRRSQL